MKDYMFFHWINFNKAGLQGEIENIFWQVAMLNVLKDQLSKVKSKFAKKERFFIHK